MKAYARELVERSRSPVDARNSLREYLQSRILECLQRAGAMIPLAFHGGTALRFLHGIPRFSEDLDFTLERDPERYDLRSILRGVASSLGTEGYVVDSRLSDKKVVHSAFVRFRGLLYELSISPQRNEVLSVKIEVDTNPPAGVRLETSVVRRHVTLQLQHHDPASLLAGKLHAILKRPFFKGRDLFDLLWYLSDRNWPAPNLALLNSALAQTGCEKGELNDENWKEHVRGRLRDIAWDAARRDVRPFMELPDQAELLTLENLMRLLT